jgi:hypothetical protein
LLCVLLIRLGAVPAGPAEREVLLAVELAFTTSRTRQFSKRHLRNEASEGPMWRMSNLQALIFIAAVVAMVVAWLLVAA